jgi:hypothetical protein
MRFQQMSLKICLLALCFASVSLSALAVPGHDQQALPPNSNVIACKILEVHANKEPGVVLVIFHQRDKKDQPRFAALLKQSTGGAIQIRPTGAQWQSAQVVRLKSCFGRGPIFSSSFRRQAALHDVAFFHEEHFCNLGPAFICVRLSGADKTAAESGIRTCFRSSGSTRDDVRTNPADDLHRLGDEIH